MNYSPLLVVDQSINSQSGNPLCHMQLTAKNVQLHEEMATLDLHGKSVLGQCWDRNLLTLMKENRSVIRLPHRLKLATKFDRKAQQPCGGSMTASAVKHPCFAQIGRVQF